jgi:hypothetical protein
MQTKYFPVATALIIILNAVIFVIGILSGEQTQIIQNYGFIPNHIFNTYDYRDNNNAQQNPLTSLQQSRSYSRRRRRHHYLISLQDCSLQCLYMLV